MLVSYKLSSLLTILAQCCSKVELSLRIVTAVVLVLQQWNYFQHV